MLIYVWYIVRVRACVCVCVYYMTTIYLQAHDASIRSMKWSHAHEWLISSDDRGLVKYWQSNMNNVHTFQAHSDPVRCLRWEDGTRQHHQHRHQCSIVLVYNGRRCDICLVDCYTCKYCFIFLINDHHLDILIIGFIFK